MSTSYDRTVASNVQYGQHLSHRNMARIEGDSLVTGIRSPDLAVQDRESFASLGAGRVCGSGRYGEPPGAEEAQPHAVVILDACQLPADRGMSEARPAISLPPALCLALTDKPYTIQVW